MAANTVCRIEDLVNPDMPLRESPLNVMHPEEQYMKRIDQQLSDVNTRLYCCLNEIVMHHRAVNVFGASQNN
jgi:hypothetical protein